MSGDSSELQATLRQAQLAQYSHDTSKALQLYQHALELLHAQIQAAAPASQLQQQLIDVFKDVLVQAEELKQAAPGSTQPQQRHQAQQGPAAPRAGHATPATSSAAAVAGLTAKQQAPAQPGQATVESAATAATAAEYQQYKEQARQFAVEAVAADGSGQVALALQLYSSLLDVLNRCHRLEVSAEVQAQIMSRFQVRDQQGSRV
jgi:hypothetical protein